MTTDREIRKVRFGWTGYRWRDRTGPFERNPYVVGSWVGVRVWRPFRWMFGRDGGTP